MDAREAPALVVIAIRADFYARSAAYPELLPYLQDHQVLVGRIGEAGLREAIEKPAATAGPVVDAALVEVLLADLGLHRYPDAVPVSTAEGRLAGEAADGRGSYEAGRLALLSYALQQTWRNRRAAGTVAGYPGPGASTGPLPRPPTPFTTGSAPQSRTSCSVCCSGWSPSAISPDTRDGSPSPSSPAPKTASRPSAPGRCSRT